MGSIGLYLSDECAKITGIELIPEAIEDAAHNAELNGVNHAEYHTGDVGAFINSNHFGEENKPDLIITDPLGEAECIKKWPNACAIHPLNALFM